VTALLLLLACAGPPSGGGRSDPPSDGHTSTPTTAPPTTPSTTTDGTTPSQEAGAPSPLRRLTAVQYRNTVADLFTGAELPPLRFPVEAAIEGFETNAGAQSASALWVDHLQVAGRAVAVAAMASPEAWLGCPADGGPDPLACGTSGLAALGERAFRRPLTSADRDLFLGFFADQLAVHGFDAAVQLTLQAYLNSPDFLYLVELSPDASGARAPLDGWQRAARLSYLIWNTMPDEAGFAAASSGALDTADGVEAEAWRLLDDPRSAAGVVDFHRQWIELDAVDALVLNYDYYPQWSPEMNPYLRHETEQLIERVWWDEGTLSQLLLDRSTEIDATLSIVYDLPIGVTELPEGQRAGLLTRAAWLSPRAHITQPSPVLRGVFVLDRMFCAPPPPPPPDALQFEGLLFGDFGTNRDRYAQHTADPACQGCHDLIDPLGFGFEQYDALGTYRELDNDLPVDATGSLTVGAQAGTAYDGAVALSALLAESPEVHDCYARAWYRQAMGRSEDPADDAHLAAVQAEFLATGGDLRSAIIALVRSDPFLTRRVGE
jgi:hypothetical protein